MAKRTKTAQVPKHTFKHDTEWVARRDGFARSGAAGIHADQKTRRGGSGRTNRVGTRRAATRAHIDLDNR